MFFATQLYTKYKIKLQIKQKINKMLNKKHTIYLMYYKLIDYRLEF